MKETWKVQESQSGKPNYNVVGDKLGGKYKIARVPFMAVEEPITKQTHIKLKEEALRHATLIAAAPELLEALQNICSCCDGNNPDHEIFYFTATAAINKALSLNN